MFKVLKYLLLFLTAPVWLPIVIALIALIGLAIYLLGYFVLFYLASWIAFVFMYSVSL